MSREILIEFKKYETEFAGILYRFKRNRDGIWIGEGDDPILRQYVREITDLCNEVFGKNTYSIQISAEFDNGVGNIFGTPSFKSVENILSVVRAVITRLNCHPELLVQKKEPETGSDQAPVDSVLGICNRFHEVARQLVHRRENRPSLEIKDEYDVQDLLHALLQIYFDDIRPEEWTPSYGGGSSRMDFLLKDHAIVVEAKLTRKGLNATEVSEQLIIDAAKYRQHRDCKNPRLFCVRPVGFGEESSRSRTGFGQIIWRRVRCDLRCHAMTHATTGLSRAEDAAKRRSTIGGA